MDENNSIMLSIAIITYQHEKYIRQTLESVFMQSIKYSYEVVIADDKSTDGTRQIIKEFKKKYPDKIKLVLQRKNKGAVKNALTMIKNCKGKYIAFLDGDDYWTDPDKISTQIDFLENNYNYSACFHNISVLSDEVIYEKTYRIRKGDINDFDTYFNIEPVIPTSSLVSRNIFENEDMNKYFSQTKFICDRIIHSILLKYGEIKYVDKNMGVYRYITRNGTSFAAKDRYFANYDLLKAFHIQYMICPKKYRYLVKRRIKEQRKNVFSEINSYKCLISFIFLEYIKRSY